MATIKISLKKDPKKDGTFPLVIRITKDRKSTFIYTEYSLKESEWDEKSQRVKKSHPNSVRLNNYLAKKVVEITDSTLEMEGSKAHVTSKALKQKAAPKSGSTFFEQADLYIKRLKEDGKYNAYSADRPRIKHFKEFLGNDTAFADLSITILERFKAWVKTTRDLSERSAVNHLVTIRSVYSQAIKEGACDPKYYPFGKGKIKIAFPDTTKVGLTADDVKRLETVQLEDKIADHARNVWLVSYYFAGARISDVFRLRWSDIKNDRLNYIMGKNEKSGSLKVPDKALKILKQYEEFKQKKDDLIFPELKQVDFADQFETKRVIALSTNRIDRALRERVAPAVEITQPLTMHIARHTFATIAGDKIPIQMLQKLYRHSHISTTVNYQAGFIHKDTDDALNAVLGI